MNIKDVVDDEINLIEIYLLSVPVKDVKKINICTDENMIKKIKDTCKNCKNSKYISYHRNELIYTYDLTNDNQFVNSKIKLEDVINDKYYIISYNDIKTSTHLFPCTNDISYVSEYSINEYKISNRLSIIIKEEEQLKMVYIEYKHSPNVDIEKVQLQIDTIFNNLLS